MSFPKHSRREFLARTSGLAAAVAMPHFLDAQSLPALDVASAGSFRAMLDGPLRTIAASTLQLDLRSHAQGADAVAHLLIDGSLIADVFVSVTASPLIKVLNAGRASAAYPIARTELVLICSPKSRFAAKFELARHSTMGWMDLLQEPELCIGRSNPLEDPGGRAILFALMIAAERYKQPTLVERILGPALNPVQVFSGGAMQAVFQSGEIDVMAGYKIGPAEKGQPYLPLPNDINLSSLNLRSEAPKVKLVLDGKTFYPEPLLFYAATLSNAPNLKGAEAFLSLLRSDDGQKLLQEHHFNAAGSASALYPASTP